MFKLLIHVIIIQILILYIMEMCIQMKENMRTVTANLNYELEEVIEKLVQDQVFPNKSELIRAAIRDLLLKYGCFEEE